MLAELNDILRKEETQTHYKIVNCNDGMFAGYVFLENVYTKERYVLAIESEEAAKAVADRQGWTITE